MGVRAFRKTLMCALLCTLLAAASARGADVGRDLQRAVEAGDAAKAAGVIARPDAKEALSDSPSDLQSISAEAADKAATLVASDAAASKKIGAFLVEMAQSALTENADDAEYHAALGEALFARGRLSRGAPGKHPEQDWLAAVESLQKAYFFDPDTGEDVLERAGFVLADACRLEKADFVLISKQVEAINGVRSRLAEEDDESAACQVAQLWFDLAVGSVSSKKRVCKDALNRSFETLAPFVAEPKDAVDAATLHNDVVTWMRAHKLIVKRYRYIMSSYLVLERNWTFDLPISHRWEFDEGAEAILQRDASGNPLRRITFRKFSWAIGYIQPDGTEVGGDNVKRLAQADHGEYGTWFSKITSRGKVRKGKLNKDAVAHMWETVGLDESDEPMRLRGYGVGGKNLFSYCFVMRSYGDDPELDPSMEAVLDTMHEVAR